jgi:hypothetical protein
MAGGEVAAGAVLAVARERLRRRRVATAVLLVLAGLGAAAPLALWSASRQTATALDRFVERANVPTTQVFICPRGHDPIEDGPDPCFEEPEPSELEAVRAVPGASAAASYSFHPVSLRTARADTGTLPAGLGVAALHGAGSTATVAGDPVIVSGRLASPTAAHDVMVTEPGARSLGVGTGDRVTFVAPVLDPPTFRRGSPLREDPPQWLWSILPQRASVPLWEDARMASYSVHEAGVAQARRLIDARQYVLRSNWGDVQPSADDENAYLESHAWEEYAAWHLALTDGAAGGTKARCAFVYGDFRRVHRSGLIACQYRAAEWRHKEVELAAHDLLQHLDRVSA